MSIHDLTAPAGAPADVDVLDRVLGALVDVRTCVTCGCTDDRACAGGCWWASLDPPVCSSCKRGGFFDALGSLL